MPVSGGINSGGSSGTFNFVTRSNIPTTDLGGQDTIMVQGFSAIGDGGEGAMYKKVGAGGGVLALQDSTNQWYELIVSGRVNVKWFGAKGDASTNDTAAIDLAISELTPFAIPGGITAQPQLYFPTGAYMTNGGHVIPSTTKFSIVGDGPYQTFLRARAPGSSGDMITANCQEFTIKDIAIQGTFLSSSGGESDALVLNAPYARVSNLVIQYVRGNGITIGDDAAVKSSGHHIADIRMRYILGYGLHVTNLNSNYDSYFTNLDIGITGKAGIRDQSGANNYTLHHVWSTGIESDYATNRGDAAGVWIQGGNCIIEGGQSETCHGDGLFIDGAGAGNNINGGNYWGNGLAGIHVKGTQRVIINGAIVRRNGTENSGATSTSGNHAGILLTGTTSDISITGNNITDDTASIAATGYQSSAYWPSGSAPSYPHPGKSAQIRQTYGIFQLGTSFQNTIIGNACKNENHTKASIGYSADGGTTNVEDFLISVNDRVLANNFGNMTPPTVASATSIMIRNTMGIVNVSGSASITTITATYAGDRLRLISTGTWTLVNATGNLNLASNFVTTSGSSIVIECDGTSWYEVGRVA
jgi:hypothetical protein